MNSNKHIVLQIVLGTITEWAIVAWLVYKLLCLIGWVLEWLCNNIINSTTAVCIGIMLIGLLGLAAVLYDPAEGDEDDA